MRSEEDNKIVEKILTLNGWKDSPGRYNMLNFTGGIMAEFFNSRKEPALLISDACSEVSIPLTIAELHEFENNIKEERENSGVNLKTRLLKILENA